MDAHSSSLPLGLQARDAAGQGSVPTTLDGDVFPPGAKHREDDGTPPHRRSAAPSFKLHLGTAIAGFACVAMLSGAIAGGGYALMRRITAPAHTADPTALALARLQQDVATLKAGVDTLHNGADLARQDDAIRGLKKSVDVLKAEYDSARGTSAAALAQLNAKLDKPDHDPSPKLAEIMTRIDKLDRDPTPKLTEITARLDRIEKQVSSPATTGSIAAPARIPASPVVSQPISAPGSDKGLPRPATLDGWIVRDVYDGIALVEGRGGGVREVTPGAFLPGAGEVRSIERRGRAWIVVTSRGIIDNATW